MTPRQLALGLLKPPEQTLDNFVPGRNGEALAVARELAAGRGPQFVYFWGPPGSGRTHLLVALAAARSEASPTGGARLHAADDVHALDEPGQARLFVLMDQVRADPAARLVAAGDRPPARLPLRDAAGHAHAVGNPGRAGRLRASARSCLNGSLNAPLVAGTGR
jgi:DnaA family protein